MKYKVISFDMFQTLVDITKRKGIIWRSILGSNYSEENALEGMKEIRSSFDSIYKKVICEESFINLEEMYKKAAKDMLKKVHFNVPYEKISYTIMKEHANAPFYENTLEILEQLSKNYKIIICSDASHLMIDKIISNIKFADVFISDDLLHYKGEPKSKFFKEVIKRLHVEPSRILHIGDSSTDIIGTQNVGIDNCLIKREGSLYDNKSKADKEISCIREVLQLLE